MLKEFQIILHILAMRDKKLSDPSSQVCSLGSKVTGSVSYLEEDNGFFWLQRNPERVEELGESLESQVVECVVEQGSVGVGEMAVAHWQEAYYRALVVKEEEDNLLLRFVDWGNTDWVSKSLVWPASWPELMNRHWPSGGFSI